VGGDPEMVDAVLPAEATQGFTQTVDVRKTNKGLIARRNSVNGIALAPLMRPRTSYTDSFCPQRQKRRLAAASRCADDEVSRDDRVIA
jgi:hypothetical protein